LYPEVTHPDIFVALSQEACDRFAETLKPGAQMLVDRGRVDAAHVRDDVKVYLLPFTDTAEGLGAKIHANMVALGALTAITRLVSPEALRQAIQTRTAASYHEANLRAFEAGFNLLPRG
jgi:2-oxoglutarate ferredoxin oxidoreductase subunit gamma